VLVCECIWPLKKIPHFNKKQSNITPWKKKKVGKNLVGTKIIGDFLNSSCAYS
jgi:hypothetical protein